ncbi:MAG: hypothetical protein E6Q45_06945 [Flavobacterium sp.]|nr:MAG: hypothetical protein E6Q45_06945 [Flavobacterium sp.]
MKKFILLFFLFSKLTFSQELVNSIDINLDKIKSFYRIEDSNNKEYALILKNKENIELIKTDKSFNVLSRFEHTEIDKSGDFIGNSIKENLFYTYWKKNKKTLEVLTIDFENKKIIKNEINYPIDSNERILSSYTKDAFFNTITVTKETSIINYYRFNGLTVEKNSFDCSNMSFVNSLNQKIKFWDFLNDENGTVYKASFPIFLTDKINFNSVHATEKKKIYVDNERIIISSDVNNNFSQFVILSLKDFTANSHIVSKQDENSIDSFLSKETNSFVIDNKIFIAKFSNERISIIIKNFDNNTLNSFSITATEGHQYINSELIEEVGGIKNREILKNEEKFLRKSFAKNPSITGFLSNDNYYLSIAGVSYPRQQSYQMLGMFGLVGGIAAAIINDGSGSSITSYSDKDVVYIRSCISSSDFKPTNLKNVTSNYDNVRSYVENNNSKENFLTLFESNNHFYLFAHKNKQEKVTIYKF